MAFIKNNFWFLFSVIIVLVLVKQSINETSIHSLKAIHRSVKLIYSPIRSYEKYSCYWIRSMKRQYKLCKNDPGMAEALLNARKLAISHCEEQFRYVRWNCSRPTKLFKQVYRETALLYSMAASALMYSVARACSDGKLKNCRCLKSEDPNVDIAAWKWGLCSDNTKYGRRFTKKFLQLNKKLDMQNQVLYHNSEVGLSTVNENVKKTCKCQGLSGSCEMKICWKTLATYEKVSLSLKKKYHAAVVPTPTNIIGKPISKGAKERSLFYLIESPSFCYLTRGRRCLDTENCATICCGRGYRIKSVPHSEYCNCKWDQILGSKLNCDNCTTFKEQYFCL